MPLTDFQRTLLADLAATSTDDRYLAGGAALHIAPNSTRYSDDLGFFHDTEARVASAFAADREQLLRVGYAVDVELSLPGFVRAVVRRGEDATRVDWAHESAWRFMPLVRDPLGGLLLHPVDLAVNKALALAGRDEPRDSVDILFVHECCVQVVFEMERHVNGERSGTAATHAEHDRNHEAPQRGDPARLQNAGSWMSHGTSPHSRSLRP